MPITNCYVCNPERCDLTVYDFHIPQFKYESKTLNDIIDMSLSYDKCKKSIIEICKKYHADNCQIETRKRKSRSPSPKPPKLKRSKGSRDTGSAHFDSVLKRIIDDLQSKSGNDVEISAVVINSGEDSDDEDCGCETDTTEEESSHEPVFPSVQVSKWKRAIMHAMGFNDSQYNTVEKIWATRDESQAINAMVGMTKIKEQYVSLLKFLTNLDRSADRSFLMHMVISGPPGHGKTAIAQLLGRAFQRSGLLKTNKFVMARRADLIGQYCGHTAVQTTKMFNKARGGVIFIDEVYSLGNNEKTDAFTKECIDTINQLLSERTDTLCIVAGYDKEIHDCFFSYNKGLERRFPWRFIIDTYKPTELVDIFTKLCKDMKWSVAPGALLETDVKPELFENAGGDINNLVTNCIMKHFHHVFMKPIQEMILSREDVLAGLALYTENKNRGKKSEDKPPIHMYV